MSEISKTPFVILGVDYLLATYPEYGIKNPYELMNGFEYDKNTTEILPVQEVFASMNNFGSVVEFAISKGYIIHPKENTSTFMFELTDIGRQVKSIGSHTKYLQLKADKENAIFENIKWNKKAAEAAERSASAAESTKGYTKTTMVLIAIYTGITFLIMITGIMTCNYMKRPQTAQTKAKSSTKEMKESRMTDTVR